MNDTKSKKQPTRTPQTHEVFPFLVGRLLGLAILFGLLLFVLYLVVFLIIPPDIFSHWLLSAKPSTRDTVSIACAVFFVITMTLWTFDSIGLFPFRNPWMSKAIWGAGVSSILATSVLFYRSPTQDNPHPIEGIWHAKFSYEISPGVFSPSMHTVVITFDPDTGKYVGNSDFSGNKSFAIRALDLLSSTASMEIAGYNGGLFFQTSYSSSAVFEDRVMQEAEPNRCRQRFEGYLSSQRRLALAVA